MDMVKGAKLLAELFEKRGATPPKTARVEDKTPLFRWVGVERPKPEDETKKQR